MNFKFNYKTTAIDFWQLSMYYMYGSLVGVCNIIFTVAMILLTFRFWGDANWLWRIVFLFLCCLFPIIQPIGIYSKAKNQVQTLPEQMALTVNDSGIHVATGNQHSNLKWNTIKRISKKPNMIVIFSSTTHGFILTNKVLGDQKESFYQFISSKI